MTKLRRSIAILLAVIMILPFASFADGEKSDIDGHWAEDATIIVNILEDRQADEKKDTQAPELVYEGETEIRVEYGAEFTLPEVTATDNVDEEVEVSYVIKDSEGNQIEAIDTTVAGTYTITYTAVDAAGNEAEALVIKVTVAEKELTLEEQLEEAKKELEAAKKELADAQDELDWAEYMYEVHGSSYYEDVLIAEAKVKDAEEKVNEAEAKLAQIKEEYKVEIELMEAKAELKEAEDELLEAQILYETHGSGYYWDVVEAEAKVKDAKERLENIRNVLSHNVINRSQIKGYETIEEAIAQAKDGDVIAINEGSYELSKQLLITKAITIRGVGEVVLKAAENFDEGDQTADKHLVAIVNVKGTVKLENLTVAGSRRTGINAFESTDVQLKDIVSKDNAGAGLNVTNSKVTAENLKTSGNGWYGVNVDNGANPSADAPESEFILISGEIAEEVQIVSDKGEVKVKLPEDYVEVVEDSGRIVWTNRTANN